MFFVSHFIAATLLISIQLLFFASTPAETSPAGEWKGSSICTVKDSPCHDETVIYHVSGIAEKPGWFSMKADKIVNGKPEYMGTLDCSYAGATHVLTCAMEKGTWEYKVEADKMTGSLHLTGGTLYRRANVQKEHWNIVVLHALREDRGITA